MVYGPAPWPIPDTVTPIASRQAAQILEQLPVDGDIEIGDQVRVGAARDAERLDGDGDARVCSGGPIVVDLLELPASLNGRRRGRLMQRGKLAGALGEILLDAPGNDQAAA